jgi:hypothetical protein
LGIFFAFICRNKNDDQEAGEHMDVENINLSNDEEHLHSTEVCFFVF